MFSEKSGSKMEGRTPSYTFPWLIGEFISNVETGSMKVVCFQQLAGAMADLGSDPA